MIMRILIFDTSAIVKLFLEEPGSKTVKFIVEKRIELGINISISIFARLEFETVLWKKAANNFITISRVKRILERANSYFNDVLHIRDTYPLPKFKVGHPMEYEQLISKYGLSIGRNDRDVWHLMCAHNYLGYLGLTGESLPHIVTSDRNFQKIITKEGYGVIDPEKVTPQNFLKTDIMS